MKKFRVFSGGNWEDFEFDDDVDILDAEDVMYNWAEQYFDWYYEDISEED